MNGSTPTRKLSQQQKHILLWLLKSTRERELWEALHPQRPGGIHVRDWGVVWRSDNLSRAESASLSRALHRLEERGLVLRQNQHSGSPGWEQCRTHKSQPAPLRCTSVLLTALGRAIAEELESKRLTSHVISNVNRFEDAA